MRPQGGFAIGADGLLRSGPGAAGLPRYTWASAGLLRRAMFDAIAPGTRMALRPVLEREIAAGRVGGTLWAGDWTDVGTPERRAALQAAG